MKKWYFIAIFFGLTAIVGMTEAVKPETKDGSWGAVVLSLTLSGLGIYKIAKAKRRATPLKMASSISPLALDVGAMLFESGPAAAQQVLEKHAAESGMDAAGKRACVIAALPSLVTLALQDGTMSEEKEQALNEFFERNDVQGEDLDLDTRERVTKGLLLHDLVAGKVRPRMQVENLPFKFMKSEHIVWCFNGVRGFEHKTKTEYEAGSRGVSVRVAKGLTLRAGAIKGQRVQRMVQEELGHGVLAVTSKHVYYKAGIDSFRVPHNKIMGVDRTSNAIIVHRDGARSRPLEFRTDEPDFMATIIVNAQNWD